MKIQYVFNKENHLDFYPMTATSEYIGNPLHNTILHEYNLNSIAYLG